MARGSIRPLWRLSLRVGLSIPYVRAAQLISLSLSLSLPPSSARGLDRPDVAREVPVAIAPTRLVVVRAVVTAIERPIDARDRQ